MAHCAKAGIKVIEVCQDKLDPDRASAQLDRTVKAGLAISSVQPSVRAMLPSTGQPRPGGLAARPVGRIPPMRGAGGTLRSWRGIRHRQWSQAKVRSPTQRVLPRPDPWVVPLRAIFGVMPRARMRRRYVS